MNHITVGVYKNGDYIVNVVRDEHLEEHIEYNTLMRFGRALYVDGECVHKGYLTEVEVDKYKKKLPEMTANIDINKPSKKYY